MDNGEPRCIAFGGLRVDDAIEEALLTVVGPGAIAAAVAAWREASNGSIKCAKHSSAIWKRRATQPIAPSDNTMPPIRPTGWWRRTGSALEQSTRARGGGRKQNRRP